MRRSCYGKLAALFICVALVGCEQTMTSPSTEEAVNFKRSGSVSTGFDNPTAAALARGIDRYNATLARAGHDMRLEYPWMFTVGRGTDPFQTLRTGTRWQIAQPLYILDASDFTTDIAAPAETDATLVSAFDTWNAVGNSFIEAVRIADSGENFDILDGLPAPGEECAFPPFDLTSPNRDPETEIITPEADIVVGGWLPPEYFEDCLGSPNILAVTWTFSGPDTDGDQYRDNLYVEQFYNEAFDWVTSGSVFLGPSLIDLESVAAHENGHAHGLGHFGGPVNRQPFSLKPNGRVFNPEAIMNPFYLGGEKRSPSPTDVAGMSTLYSRAR